MLSNDMIILQFFATATQDSPLPVLASFANLHSSRVDRRANLPGIDAGPG
jgi:hypothetical protein